jgi:hypothetical protein
MTDVKITDLPVATVSELDGENLIPIVTDTLGAPTTQAVSISDLGLWDSWVPSPGTYSYVSAASFTVTEDRTHLFTPGLRVRFTPGVGYKYFKVVSSSYTYPLTTVTITGGGVYSLASGDYDCQVSYGDTPQAYPNYLFDDGWILDLNTYNWTYVSATTFIVSGDVRTRFPVGTKIKLTQTTVKYFYVVSTSYSSPNTTITVSGGSDYTLANAAITLPYYSYVENPQGFPHWFNFACVPSGTSGSAGTYAESQSTCKFALNGRTLHTKIHKVVSNVGSWGGAILLPTPMTVVVQNNGAISFNGAVYASGAAANAPLGVLYEIRATHFSFIKTVGAAELGWGDVAANVGFHVDVTSQA